MFNPGPGLVGGGYSVVPKPGNEPERESSTVLNFLLRPVPVVAVAGSVVGNGLELRFSKNVAETRQFPEVVPGQAW